MRELPLRLWGLGGGGSQWGARAAGFHLHLRLQFQFQIQLQGLHLLPKSAEKTNELCMIFMIL